jgi:N-acetylneuraminic acid mutarotase
MKKIRMSIYFMFFIGSTGAQNTWLQRDSVGGPPKSAAAAFSVNNRGFVVGGIDQFEYKRKCYKYNPTTDNWSTVTSLGGALGSGLERASAVAFTTYSHAYVGLGQGSNPFFDDFWEYDPVADAWTQIADFGGSGRTQAVAFCIQEKGYVGTGYDATGYKKDFYMYDPMLNTWTQVADFGGTARRQAVGFNIGDAGYVGTGEDGTFKKDFWQYNAFTDTWTQKADFGGTPRYGASGFASFPQGFIGTGYDNTLNYTNDFWEYNYWSDTWVQRADLPCTPRANGIGFWLVGYGYMGSGYDGEYKDDFYIYTPVIGVEEYSAGNVKVSVYPNPVSSDLYFNFDPNSISSIHVYDVQGRRVFSSAQNEINSMSTNYHIDCSVIPNGTYFCEFRTDRSLLATRKIVISK